MRSTLHMLIPGRKLLLLAAIMLMAITVYQKPSTLLLLALPKVMAATTVRLLFGLLAALGIRACLGHSVWKSNMFNFSRLKNLLLLALMIALLVFMYKLLGSRAFSGLRVGDLLMHRAFITQLVAFTALWLSLLR